MNVEPRGSVSSVASPPGLAPVGRRNPVRRGRISHAPVRGQPLHEASESDNSDFHRGNVFPWPFFVRQLQREQRRADRTDAPLSIIRLRPATGSHINVVWGAQMLDLVQSTTRDTDIVSQCDAAQVVVLLPETDERGARRLIEKLSAQSGSPQFSATSATYPDGLFELVLSEQPRDDGDSMDLFAVGPSGSGNYRGKRALDIAVSAVALLLLLPLMAAVALAVKLSSPGPVIFKQARLGKRGVPFTVYKFRSMRLDTDDTVHREFVSKLIKGEHGDLAGQADDAVKFKIKRDPRVTRVGAFIRKTSIDELPQFFNVLRGDMSVVGPRPPIKYEAENYRPWHLRRVLEAKPGVTGIWQVYGRSKVAFDDMVRMDLSYIRNASLWLDLRLIVATVGVVLKRDGAV